ncbi:hypothetical protein JCM13210_09310 [Thermaerobacter litoralis]
MVLHVANLHMGRFSLCAARVGAGTVWATGLGFPVAHLPCYCWVVTGGNTPAGTLSGGLPVGPEPLLSIGLNVV